jgi:hypothetical protein
MKQLVHHEKSQIRDSTLLLSVRDVRAVMRQTQIVRAVFKQAHFAWAISGQHFGQQLAEVHVLYSQFMFIMNMDRYRLCLAACWCQDTSLEIRGVFETFRGTFCTVSNGRITNELGNI